MQSWSFLIYNFMTKKCNAVIKISYYAEDFAQLKHTWNNVLAVFTVTIKCFTVRESNL